ncbi:MAG: FAD-dependent oxidoreductase, partial [Syntrophomonadaceae bacterium]|nr:FAD-dependent oxidoreductase [Syntrophomonadaceae bacterium]
MSKVLVYSERVPLAAELLTAAAAIAGGEPVTAACIDDPSAAEELAALGADEIILATGATPCQPPIKGLDRANVMEAIEYLRGTKQTGQRVAVVGGGLTGCEIAYDLVLKGKKPVIIEMMDDLLKVKYLCASNSNMLRDLIRYHHIPVELNAKVTEITDQGVKIDSLTGVRNIPCDSVVMSVGY